MNTLKILTLSGWGQPHNALSVIAPNATYFDYSHFETVENALFSLAEKAKKHDVVIGWSLGGQLAVRAISAGLILPSKLVLIGVPFQFVKNTDLEIGMPVEQFQKFRDNYAKNSARTLAKAWELVAVGDKNIDKIKTHLQNYNQAEMLKKNWLHWLDMLDGFSCKDLDFSKFPPSLLLHGENDAVVLHDQCFEFSKKIQHAKQISIANAGHAPHWHDNQLIIKHIQEYLDAK